jgi:hypothetical protein
MLHQVGEDCLHVDGNDDDDGAGCGDEPPLDVNRFSAKYAQTLKDTFLSWANASCVLRRVGLAIIMSLQSWIATSTYSPMRPAMAFTRNDAITVGEAFLLTLPL